MRREPEIRRSSVTLWTAILALVAAWAMHLELRYALIEWACANGKAWLLTALSIPLLLVANIGAAIGWRYAQSDLPRIRFMALTAVALGLLFSLIILTGTLPDFFIGPCD